MNLILLTHCEKILTWRWKSMTHTEHRLCSEPRLKEIYKCEYKLQPQFRFLYHILEEGGTQVYECVRTQESLLLRLIKAGEVFGNAKNALQIGVYGCSFFIIILCREPPNTRHVPRKTRTQSKPNYARGLRTQLSCITILSISFCFRSLWQS
jgi:hypothetical protein